MYQHHGPGALDYFPCHYGASRLVFRGPQRPLDAPYCAVLGGTETYGKFIEQPFPAILEQQLGRTVVNLGCVNAGVDAFAGDEAVLDLCAQAEVTVVQILGAHNCTNRYYKVHPRRNDRFLRATAMLQAIYREVDFSDFHFTRHMLKTLKDRSPERFALVLDELRATWLRRMRFLAQRVSGRSVLLWLGKRPAGTGGDPSGLGEDPLFVDRAMVDAIRPLFDDYVEVIASPGALARGVEGMVFSPLEQPAALQMPGPDVHDQVAEALAPRVAPFLS